MPEHAASIAKNAARFAPYAGETLSGAQGALVRQDLVELEFKTARKALLAVEVDMVLATRPGLQQLVACLATVPGLTPFSAAWLLAEVGPASRYPTVRHFLSYCGCCPRVVSSAGKVYSAHVTRRSNKHARTIFYQAAVVVCNLLKSDSAIKRYALRTRARKGGRSFKLACCIVSAKIARVAYAVIRDQAPFDADLGANEHLQPELQTAGFTVADRRTIAKAHKCLRHVSEVLGTHPLGADAQRLANALDDALRGKFQ
jgi:transposase